MAIIQSIFLLKCYGSLVRVNTQKKSSFLNQAHVYISIINQSEDAQLSVSPRLNSAQNNSLHVPNRDEIQFPYHALRQEGKQQQQKKKLKTEWNRHRHIAKFKAQATAWNSHINIRVRDSSVSVSAAKGKSSGGRGKQQPSAYVQVQRIQRLFVLVINIQTSTRRKKGGKRSTVEKQHQNILPLGPPILAGKGERGGKCAAKEKG